MLATLKRLWKDEDAPTAVEYGIMVALIAIVIIVAVTGLGNRLVQVFTGATNAMPAAPAQ